MTTSPRWLRCEAGHGRASKPLRARHLPHRSQHRVAGLRGSSLALLAPQPPSWAGGGREHPVVEEVAQQPSRNLASRGRDSLRSGSSRGLRGFETGAERPPQPPSWAGVALDHPVVEEVAQQPSRKLGSRGWDPLRSAPSPRLRGFETGAERPPQPPLGAERPPQPPSWTGAALDHPVVEEVAQQPSRNLARRGWDSLRSGSSRALRGFETGAERPPQPPLGAERPPQPPSGVAERIAPPPLHQGELT